MNGVIYLVVMADQKGRSGRSNGEMIPPKITVGAPILQVILRTKSFEAGGVLTYSRGCVPPQKGTSVVPSTRAAKV